MITRQIGHAMAAQVQRVNDSHRVGASGGAYAPVPVPVLSSRSTAAERQLAKALEAAQSRIADLETQVAALQRDLLGSAPATAKTGGLALDSRPVMSVKDAAATAGCSPSTVTRYLNSGRWQGRRDDANNWLVFADQPLTTKRG